MNKAIFLDRDGTLIEEKNYLSKIEDIALLPYCLESLKKLQEAGYLLIIVTNQSGVARGYFSEEKVIKINQYLEKLFADHEIDIAMTYYCPHYETGIIKDYAIRCDCRKPQIGLIKKAMQDFNLDLSKCYVIGDKESDLQLAKNAGCRGIFLKNDHYAIAKSEQANYIGIDLLDIANYIIKNDEI